MARDLSFFDYKHALKQDYSTRNLSLGQHTEIFREKSLTEFYRLSFYNRTSAELEYQILSMLVKLDENDIPKDYKTRAKYYLESYTDFLIRDADIAENTAEAKPYKDHKALLIKERTLPSNLDVLQTQSDKTEWQKSVERFLHDVHEYVSAPWHVSKLITLLSYLNLYRLLTVFSRLSFKSFWTLASEQHWIDAQDNLWGRPLNRSALDQPTSVLNVLSVALFVLRSAAHFAAMYKHAMSQRPGEKEIDQWERIKKEFFTRLENLANDLIWMVVNLLTNYASVWHFSDPFANTLLAMTLVYDSVWLGIHWYRKECAWNVKERELLSWQQDQQPDASGRGDGDEAAFTAFELKILADIRLELRVKYIALMLAALSITVSYLLFLAAISTAVSTICLLVCVTGFAMYGSADQLAAWMRAQFGTYKITGELEKMRGQFFNDFLLAAARPVLVMGLLAVSWQLAALATVASLLYPYMPKWRFGERPELPARVDGRGAVPENLDEHREHNMDGVDGATLAAAFFNPG